MVFPGRSFVSLCLVALASMRLEGALLLMAILSLMRASSMPNVFLRGSFPSLVVIVSALSARGVAPERE
jgi:hypothetical protein